MKYYSITTDENYGVQVLHDGIAGDSLDGKNLYKEFNKDLIEDLVLDLDNGAKMADILETGDLGLKGLIVSSKSYDLLSKFNLHSIQFVNIKGNGLDDYKFMFFNGDLTSKIDYNKSNFKLYELDIIDMEFEELDLKIPQNREGIIKADVDIVSVDIDKKIFPSNGYQFNEDFRIEDFDIFRIGHYDLNFYVSEKVKDIFEKNDITGCQFIEQKMLVSSNFI